MGTDCFLPFGLLFPNPEGPEGLTRANAREQSISLWESGEFTPRGSVIPFNGFSFRFELRFIRGKQHPSDQSRSLLNILLPQAHAQGFARVMSVLAWSRVLSCRVRRNIMARALSETPSARDRKSHYCTAQQFQVASLEDSHSHVQSSKRLHSEPSMTAMAR